jgi:hypothetical protein
MSLQPFEGFQHFTTHHCVTGSQRHIYAFHGYPVSEELLLGLGAGVGFIYWHIQGTLPFLGGRANAGRPGEEGMEKTAGRRTGVAVELLRSISAAKAEKMLLQKLTAGQPVMLVLDMGYLPYFDFGGEEFHFGYHVVVACGYDPESRQVLVADRDEALHPVSLEALARARGSKCQPFPPQHGWYILDFTRYRPPEPAEVWQAISESARGMVQPPITNLGVKGIRKAAQRILSWPRVMDEKMLREACFNTFIMIDAQGGTGGGLFRYMYARFLEEAADLLGEFQLAQVGGQLHRAGDYWQEVAGLCHQASTAIDPASLLSEVCALLPEIARQEEIAWSRLSQLSEGFFA